MIFRRYPFLPLLTHALLQTGLCRIVVCSWRALVSLPFSYFADMLRLYTRVQRASSRLFSATASDVTYFRSVVGAAHVLTEPDDVAPYNTDWLRHHTGASRCVIRPASTSEVSAVLAHCSARGLAVVPQGGNTGLVGGSVPHSDEVVLSLRRMSTIDHFDEDAGVVSCGAGVVLATLEEYVNARGFIVPLDLGAKGSCVIGGNVSTNAGGLRLVRYGSLHGSVLGVEAVLADGTVLDMMSTLRKDNVGFDLKQLFIGSEGTLGVVTRVAILTAPKPAAVNVAVLAVSSFDGVRQLLKLTRTALGEVLSAAEFVDGHALGIALDQLRLPPPLAAPEGCAHHPFYFFVETSGSNGAHDTGKLNLFLEEAMGSGLVSDGVVASDMTQAKRLFRYREDTAVAIAQRGYVYKYDVSLKLKDMYSLVEAVRARLDERGWGAKGVITVGYGHIADGNLHLNVSTVGHGHDLTKLEADLEPFIYEWVISRGGSISAEHGLGSDKAEWLDKAKPAPVVDVMQKLKALLDPQGILNPGKVLPPWNPKNM